MTKKKAFFIIGITAILIALLFSACGLLKPLMSDKEMEERLQELYGEEFVVVSSKSFPTDDAFRARVYNVSPKDEPEFTFYAYNFIRSESDGVFGVRNSTKNTYIEKGIQTLLEKYASEEGLEFTTEYSIRLYKQSILVENGTDSFTNIVNKFNVTPETLDEISDKLASILSKILAEKLYDEYMTTRCYLSFNYFEDGKNKNEYFTSLFAYGWDSENNQNRPVDISADGIKKMIVG